MSTLPANPQQPPRFSFNWVKEVLGYPVVPPRGSDGFAEILHDSRQATDSSLFIALPGERVDGHTYLESVLSKSVRGVISSQAWIRENPAFLDQARDAGIAVFEVSDTLNAYRKLAQSWRNRFQIPVFCIAGSVGKTTTKELLSAILQARFPNTLKTLGSQNGFVGIPMTLLSLSETHSAAVIEVGIDEPAAMASHLEIVRPTQSIVTAIGPEHLEKLIDLETVTREEAIALSWTLQAGGRIAVPESDPYLYPYFRQKIQQPQTDVAVATYALKDTTPDLPTPTVRGDWKAASSTLKVIVSATGTLSSGEFDLPCPLPGRHNALNLLGAVTLALQAGLTSSEIQAGLKEFFKGAFGRSDLQALSNGTRVLCDYYNSNPTSVRAGIDTLLELTSTYTPKPRKWVCLADMLELGPEEERFHRELAQPLLQSGIDQICLYGERMHALHHELRTRNMGANVRHFATHAEMANVLAREVQPSDWILIKGSRGMKMETVFELWKSQIGATHGS